jgi:excisionase family DNA binding protein
VNRGLVGAAAIAELLDVPTSWVLESARSGQIPHIRLGRYVRFDLDAVDEWIKSCSSPGRAITFRRGRS